MLKLFWSNFLFFILFSTLSLGATNPTQSAKPFCYQALQNLSGISPTHTEEERNYYNLERLFKYAQAERLNWLRYKNGVFKGQRVFALQLSGLKDLSENLWNPTGTEGYLETLHIASNEVLNKESSRIILSNYKNHFTTSSLSYEEFQEQVVTPLIDALAEWLQVQQARSKKLTNLARQGWNWKAWLKKNIIFADGQDLFEAQFKIAQHRFQFQIYKNLSFAEWRAVALARRDQLKKICQRLEIDWNYMIYLMHTTISRNRGGLDSLTAQLKAYKAPPFLFKELLYYLDDLSVADFFPLPEVSFRRITLEDFINERRQNPLGNPRLTWEAEHRAALHIAAGNIKYVVAMDVTRLGYEARLKQDLWIQKGAVLEQLPTVYEEISRNLQIIAETLTKKFNATISGEGRVQVYKGDGDELVFMFPNLTAEKLVQIQKYLLKISAQEEPLLYNLHVSPIIEIKEPSLVGLNSGIKEAQLSMTDKKSQSPP